MSDASHAFCRKCNAWSPLIWRSFKETSVGITNSGAIVSVSHSGMGAQCEVCSFEVAKLSTGPTYSTAAA